MPVPAASGNMDRFRRIAWAGARDDGAAATSASAVSAQYCKDRNMALPVLGAPAFGRPEGSSADEDRRACSRHPATHWGALPDEGNSIDFQIDRLDDG